MIFLLKLGSFITDGENNKFHPARNKCHDIRILFLPTFW